MSEFWSVLYTVSRLDFAAAILELFTLQAHESLIPIAAARLSRSAFKHRRNNLKEKISTSLNIYLQNTT